MFRARLRNVSFAALSGLAASACSEGNHNTSSAGSAATGSNTPGNEGNSRGAPLDGAAIDTTLRTIGADDPRIQYSGRVDFADPKQPTYSAPAASVSVRFAGTSISALLGDEFRYGSERSYHDVVIDGAITKKLMMEPGVEKYELASGLSARIGSGATSRSRTVSHNHGLDEAAARQLRALLMESRA